jgi:hypothetical protein
LPVYTAYNAPMQTTAAIAKVTTGTSIKTMLQIATPSTRQLTILSWGFSIDTAPTTTGVGVVELLQTDVAATVTAHVAAGVQPADPNGTASLMTLGATATGYTGTSEGSTTATRTFDAQEVLGVSSGAQPNVYVRDFMPDERPLVAVSKFLRVRVTFSVAANMLTWVTWSE